MFPVRKINHRAQQELALAATQSSAAQINEEWALSLRQGERIIYCWLLYTGHTLPGKGSDGRTLCVSRMDLQLHSFVSGIAGVGWSLCL